MPEEPLATTDSDALERAGRANLKQRILREALRQGCLNEDQHIAGFVDIDGVSSTIASLIEAFPSNFRHTFAVKANSMRNALTLVRNMGLGCEVASAGELQQALQAGFAPKDIVYDEPAKTVANLRFVLEQGINFNIDNFQEYERVSELVDGTSDSRIGFRINPQVGSGTIGAMSTATATSKFGIALQDSGNRERLAELYLSEPWLTTIHTHIGSQGCSLELMVEGIRSVVDFALDVNAAGGRISVIDIGGGLPVNFASEEITPTFLQYSDSLRVAVPELFTGDFICKTEFGRSIYAKNGFIASRVEYTKQSGGRQIAICHAGAQVAARTAFMPKLWEIRISVFDSNGDERTGKLVEQDVTGPCCFAGDILAHKRSLPLIQPGDYVMLHDTGAYYFSNPFYYNSLPPCAVYGAKEIGAGDVSFNSWRKQISSEELAGIFG